MLTTVDGNKMESTVSTDKVNRQLKPGTKGVILTVTDPRL